MKIRLVVLSEPSLHSSFLLAEKVLEVGLLIDAVLVLGPPSDCNDIENEGGSQEPKAYVSAEFQGSQREGEMTSIISHLENIAKVIYADDFCEHEFQPRLTASSCNINHISLELAPSLRVKGTNLRDVEEDPMSMNSLKIHLVQKGDEGTDAGRTILTLARNAGNGMPHPNDLAADVTSRSPTVVGLSAIWNTGKFLIVDVGVAVDVHEAEPASIQSLSSQWRVFQIEELTLDLSMHSCLPREM
jgi:hypothetical protein